MNGNFVGIIINIVTKYLIKRIHYPIACAKSVSDELFIHDNIKANYIRNGITQFQKNFKTKNEIKNQLELDINCRYFISIGRLSPEKNFYTLMNAFKEANLTGFKLIIIGDGNLMEALKNIIDVNIIMTGFKAYIGDYLAASDYYITISLTEGLSLSTLYAMSTGLPLLLSDIPSHKEIFELAEGKEIVSIIVNNNQETIIDTIKKIATHHEYNKLSEEIISLYNTNFTAKKMSKQYQKPYEDALKQEF